MVRGDGEKVSHQVGTDGRSSYVGDSTQGGAARQEVAPLPGLTCDPSGTDHGRHPVAHYGSGP